MQAAGGVRRGQTRHEGKNYRGDDGEGGRNPEKAGVHGEIQGANGNARSVASQDGDEGLGAQNADGGAGSAEDQAFGELHAAKSPAAGTKSGADGEFAFAADGAGENQVRNVGAGNDENEAGSGKQNDENGASTGGQLVAKELGGNFEVGLLRVCVRVLFLDSGIDGLQFRASLLEGGPGSEAAEEFGHAMNAAGDHRRGEMVRAGDDVGDDLRVLGIGDAGLEDADDGGGTVAETDGFADDGRIALERVGPEAIGEDNHAGGVGAIVFRANQPTENGMEAHHFKIVAANNASLDFTGFAEADHGESDGGEIAEFAESLDVATQVLNFGDGECGVFLIKTGSTLADVNDAVLVLVDERFQEDAPDESKDGGVGSDAECEREDHGDGQAGRAPK